MHIDPHVHCRDEEQSAKETIRKSGKNYRIIACGGINSPERVRERLGGGADEIQIYTGLIFGGTRLLRELRASS